MRILDENGNEIQEKDVDYDLGFLSLERVVIQHHDEIPEVQKESHIEVVAEYPNGGKDTEEVIDVPYQPAVPAWDEYEEILRYKLYNSYEIAQRRIEELKKMLTDTDYVVVKIAEGAAERSEYQHIIDQRAQWREEINELEKINEETENETFR